MGKNVENEPKKKGKLGKIIRICVFAVIIFAVLGAIGGGGSKKDKPANDGQGQKQEQTQESNVEREYKSVTVAQLEDDLKNNAMSAKNTYEGNYYELSGKLSNIDSDGKYINLTNPDDEFDLVGIQCYLKNDEQKQQVSKLTTGEIVTVKGKIKSVGEVLGYSFDIDEIVSLENSDTAEDATTDSTTPEEAVEEYAEVSISEMHDDLDQNALAAADKYKGHTYTITGKLFNIDASGEYISIASDEYGLQTVLCNIKDESQKERVMSMSTNDTVTLKIKVKDVGEILGYVADIVEIP